VAVSEVVTVAVSGVFTVAVSGVVTVAVSGVVTVAVSGVVTVAVSRVVTVAVSGVVTVGVSGVVTVAVSGVVTVSVNWVVTGMVVFSRMLFLDYFISNSSRFYSRYRSGARTWICLGYRSGTVTLLREGQPPFRVELLDSLLFGVDQLRDQLVHYVLKLSVRSDEMTKYDDF